MVKFILGEKAFMEH